MGKYYFSDEEVEFLANNPFVKRVSNKGITYTDEFKLLFVTSYENGETSKEIFEEHGFVIEMLGERRINSAAARWRRGYKKNGLLGLSDTRETNSGRTTKREHTLEEKLKRAEAKILLQERQIELLKKLDVRERSVKRVLSSSEIFELINEIVTSHNLKGMVSFLCSLADVSRSGYYSYISKASTLNREEKLKLEYERYLNIKEIYDSKQGKLGSRQIKMRLEKINGIIYNLKSIQRIMKKYGLVCKTRKARPYAKQLKATKEHQTYENILNRGFRHDDVMRTLLTDITYLRVGGKFYYLSVIMDSNTSEVISFKLSKTLKIDFVIESVNELKGVTLHKDVLLHSDQGTHYTSPKYSKLLKVLGITQSMSRRGNCWDNAPIESFFGHLKDEIDINDTDTISVLNETIKEYVQYYNNERFQWNRKKMTPVQYRNHLLFHNSFSQVSLT